MTIYYRWILGPLDNNGQPQYADTNGIDTYYGYNVNDGVLEDLGYHGLLDQFPDHEWGITRFYGEGNDGWQGLGVIHTNYHDTDTVADFGGNVWGVLATHVGEVDWSIDYSGGTNPTILVGPPSDFEEVE